MTRITTAPLPVPIATASSRRFGSAAIPYDVRSTIGLLSNSYVVVLYLSMSRVTLTFVHLPCVEIEARRMRAVWHFGRRNRTSCAVFRQCHSPDTHLAPSNYLRPSASGFNMSTALIIPKSHNDIYSYTLRATR